MARTAAAGPRRVAELDGVRAIAIVAVLLVHCFAVAPMSYSAGELHGVAKVGYLIAAHGWLGVDLFFVLSGFLITGILLDSRGRPTYFSDFWVRRALRILPLLVAVVFVLSFVYRPSIAYIAMALFFAVDFAPLFGLGNNGMGPLWSLAVEEQFYLIWPFLVFWLRPRALAVVTLTMFVAEPVVRLATAGGLLDVVWCRVDGLAIGALLAIYVRSRFYTPARTLRLAALAVAAAAVLLAIDLRAHVTSYALRITEADLVFAALVATAFAASGSPALRVLRSAPARFIADTSFCAYLIHVPLLDLARTLGAGAGAADPFVAAAWRAAVAVPLTFGIAALSRTYLELPFLRLKDRLAPAPALAVVPRSGVAPGTVAG